MDKSLRLGDQIGQLRFRGEGRGTFHGEYGGNAVIIKRGGERLIHEADTLRAIDDDRIPKLIDISKGADNNILVMSKLGGVELSQLIELSDDWASRPLVSEEAIRIIQGITLGFIAVRSAGRLYRDLDLSHVLVSSTDVGLCDHEADIIVDERGRGLVNSSIGTWETMSPEEFTIGNTMSEASNTYTLGVLLLQLTTGHNPFFVADSKDMKTKDLKKLAYESHLQDLTIDTGIVGIDRLLSKALAQRLEDRYQTLTAFQEALSTLLRV